MARVLNTALVVLVQHLAAGETGMSETELITGLALLLTSDDSFWAFMHH